MILTTANRGLRRLSRKPDPRSGGLEIPPASFDWPVAMESEKLLRELVAEFLDRHSVARFLAERMLAETGTDFFEWIDHIILSAAHEHSLRAAGFLPELPRETPAGQIAFALPTATLPRVLVTRSRHKDQMVIAVRPEDLADFAARNDLRGPIMGEPFARYRRLLVSRYNGATLEAIERHAYRGFVEAPFSSAELRAVVKARELWRTRPRRCSDEKTGFKAGRETLNQVLDLVGRDRACQYFFENERAYWQDRNHAARLQKHRQDHLGLGWGNHDHHTFRCSRKHFVDLIDFLLELGFQKRERFYAGAEAGWGAQILEQPVAGIVVFADVDLRPEETGIDFSSHRLPPASGLGTVGLWVALHGESFLEAGMHHLEARFDFELLQAQLKQHGVNTMAPFSNFQFLRQAFTEGERWPVRRERLDSLFAAGLITRQQMAQFATSGAIGSHLENLQRRGGFKGFNQKSVSAIIAATDPRRARFQA